MQFQEELASTENKVAFARQAFNDSVLQYNNSAQNFPNNVIAGFFSFEPASFLEIESEETRGARSFVSPDSLRLQRRIALNFFDAQDKARRSSAACLSYVPVDARLIVAGVSAVVAFALYVLWLTGPGTFMPFGELPAANSLFRFWHRCGLVALFIAGATLFKTTALSSGGGRKSRKQMGGTLSAPT